MTRVRLCALVGAVVLAVVGVVGVLRATGNSKSAVSLSAGSSSKTTSVPYGDDALDVPTTAMDLSEITTPSTGAPKATTTTTIAAPTTAPTTVAPPTTTTLPANSVVVESVKNDYPYAMDITVGTDVDSLHWVIEPGTTTGAAVLKLGEHEGVGSHVVMEPTCGNGGDDSLFTAGHHYRFEVSKNGLEHSCLQDLPGYKIVMFDLTAGTSRQV